MMRAAREVEHSETQQADAVRITTMRVCTSRFETAARSSRSAGYLPQSIRLLRKTRSTRGPERSRNDVV